MTDSPMTPETVDSRDAQRLAESPALVDYLLSTIQVAQSGEACEGHLVSPVDLASGAELTFACPEVVESVEVYRKGTLAGRAAELFSQEVEGRLVLLTCEEWDGTRYLSNVVVTAVPVEAVTARG